jgi:hypothetical protein
MNKIIPGKLRLNRQKQVKKKRSNLKRLEKELEGLEPYEVE